MTPDAFAPTSTTAVMRHDEFFTFTTLNSGMRTCAVVYVIWVMSPNAVGTGATCCEPEPGSRMGYTLLRRASRSKTSNNSANFSGYFAATSTACEKSVRRSYNSQRSCSPSNGRPCQRIHGGRPWKHEAIQPW